MNFESWYTENRPSFTHLEAAGIRSDHLKLLLQRSWMDCQAAIIEDRINDRVDKITRMLTELKHGRISLDLVSCATKIRCPEEPDQPGFDARAAVFFIDETGWCLECQVCDGEHRVDEMIFETITEPVKEIENVQHEN